MAKTSGAASTAKGAAEGKTYGYQSTETAAPATSGGGSAAATGGSGGGSMATSGGGSGGGMAATGGGSSAATGGGSMAATGGGVAAKKERLFDAFEDLINELTSSVGGTTTPGPAYPSATGSTSSGSGGGATGTAGGTTGSATTEYPTNGGTGHPNGETHVEIPVALLRENYREDLAKAAVRQSGPVRQPGRAPTQDELDRKHTADSNRAPFQRTQEFAPSYGTRGRSTGATPEVIAAPVLGERPETAPAKPMAAGAVLDAYWGSFGTPVERAQERARILSKQQQPDMYQLEAIIGSDDRTLVTSNEAYPWRCICSLLMTAASGQMYVGTGWLVSPRVVLTAGHCVYMSDEGGWVTQIEVIPGRFAEKRPFGSAVSRDLRSVTGWTVDNDRDFDYGAILLPEDKKFGDTLGWFGYANRDDDYIRGVTLNLAGYPGDGGKAGPERQQGTPWYNSRTVREVSEHQLSYEIDTWGGQSGAPVWELAADGSRYGLAIHTWGTSVSNGGTRITRQVFDNVVGWVGQTS